VENETPVGVLAKGGYVHKHDSLPAEGGDLHKTQVIVLAKGGYFHKHKTVYQLRVKTCTKHKSLY
jgi:hypothetical protein